MSTLRLNTGDRVTVEGHRILGGLMNLTRRRFLIAAGTATALSVTACAARAGSTPADNQFTVTHTDGFPIVPIDVDAFLLQRQRTRGVGVHSVENVGAGAVQVERVQLGREAVGSPRAADVAQRALQSVVLVSEGAAYGVIPKGATGSYVRTLVNLAKQLG